MMDNAADIRILQVTELGFGGDGIAREGDDVVFIPYAVPGDTLRVKILQSKGHQKWGRILDVLSASPDRLAHPPCVHCFDCGGCQLQQMSRPAYQAWKYQSVVDRLEKGGLVPRTLHPLIVISEGTRRRATFCAQRVGKSVKIGFNRHHSDQVIDLSECRVVMEPIMNLLPSLRVLMDVLLDRARQADIAVTLLETGLDVLITGEIELNLIKNEALAEFVQGHEIARISLRESERAEAEVILQPRPARIIVGGIEIDPAPGSFLQPSREGEEALIAAVQAGVGPAKKVLDLFSGLGTFSFPLAAGGAQVRAVDADGPGIRAASRAANTARKIEFQVRNLYRDPLRAAEMSSFDAIVFDPPRAGAKGQAPEISRSGVPTIVAVSCNPASFVTDCAPFVQEDGYTLTDLYVVDQFIWSAHVELVGIFHRSTGAL